MAIFDLPESPCPECGKLLNQCAGWIDQSGPPEPGDATICGGCMSMLIFDAHLHLRRATPAELRWTMRISRCTSAPMN